MNIGYSTKRWSLKSRREPDGNLPHNYSSNPTLSLLRRFEPMAQLDWHTLATLARLAREIVVPAKRLLVRPPRRLEGVWYLCSGSLLDERTGERLVAGSQRCRQPVYPGHTNLRCLGEVRLLHFDANESRQFGLYPDGIRAGDSMAESGGDTVAQVTNTQIASAQVANAVAGAAWIETLAASPVLRLLYRRRGASGWQRWLRALEPQEVARGSQVITPGSAGECFYIVQSGVALVDDTSTNICQPLAKVFAGGFFGEDAVLTGRSRNARVHMPVGGRLLRGEVGQLRSLVTDVWWALASNPDSWSGYQTPLRITPAEGSQALRQQLETLSRSEPHGLSANEDNGLVSLALLLLVHRGYRVLLRNAPVEQEIAGVR